MGVSLVVKGFSDKEDPTFNKHLSAVRFCIQNNLSLPKETSEFFRGKVYGEDPENYVGKHLIEHLKNGVEIPLTLHSDPYGATIRIKVSEIPEGVSEIIASIEA